MRIKSYFAESVQEAIEKARIELGPDAMLMNSKKTDFELRALGAFEVVFGLPGQSAAAKPRLQAGKAGVLEEDASATAVFDETKTMARTGAAPAGKMAQELAELRKQIETVKRSVSRQQRLAPGGDEKHSPAAAGICARLMAADLSEDLAQEIAEAVEFQAFAWKQGAARGSRDFELVPSETLELALAAELERRFQVSPELGLAGAGQKRVLFAGPAGAGKTTSLIKLGLRYGLQARLPLHIFSLDTLRVGGWEHLAAYARIAGLGFDAVHNLTTLEQLLSQHADKKLILIDTPGFGPADLDDLGALGQWVSGCKQLDTQLVMPATLRPSLVTRMLERFAPLKPSKLLLTRADETESAGVLVDFAIRAKLPLSYISNGQTIPEDMEQASKEDLLADLGIRRQGQGKREAA